MAKIEEIAEPDPADATAAKDKVLDKVFWSRQVLSVLFGVLCGLVPLTGWLGFVAYFGGVSAAVFVYYKNMLGVNDEEYGGPWELHKEGFMSAFAAFVFFWVVTYSTLHV